MPTSEHFARTFEHTVQVGDRVRLGPITLVARELSDDGVARVGLKLQGFGGTLAGRARIGNAIAKLFGRN